MKFTFAKKLLIAVTALGIAVAVSSGAAVSAAIVPAPLRKPALGFELSDASGTKVNLAQYRGKVVLLDFWATECGGCVQEMPFFIKAAETHRNGGLAVIGVSVDVLYEDLKNTAEGWSKVKPFIQSHHVNYPILMAESATTKAYKIEALPITYLIDKQGKVAATYNGVVDPANVEANIQALLLEK